ncbi:Neurotransmitter-gated ion-channel transmembrane region, partial [Sarracenia purpurea var. burkii]
MQFSSSCQIHGPSAVTFGSLLSQELSPSDANVTDDSNKSPVMNNPAFLHSSCPPAMHRSCFCVRLIAEHTKMLEDSTKVSESFLVVFFSRFQAEIKLTSRFLDLFKVGVCFKGFIGEGRSLWLGGLIDDKASYDGASGADGPIARLNRALLSSLA